jgi:hypothetical protein
MHFKERDLPSHGEPVSAAELREGSVYFSVHYADDELLIPTMETLVFIGRDLEPGDSGQVYFQDIDSYKAGVRFEMPTEGGPARFSTGSEAEVSHIFEYEQALEELMRCSVRRRQHGGGSVTRAEGFQAGEAPSLEPLDFQTRSLRFDNDELQTRFITELGKANVSFEVRADGAVTCLPDDWPALNSVAHTIRGSCFRWYFIWWKTFEESHRFWQEMKASGLPFQVEHHEDRIVFLVPRGSEDLHRTIAGRVHPVPPVK